VDQHAARQRIHARGSNAGRGSEDIFHDDCPAWATV
jgi:hypothetical protein